MTPTMTLQEVLVEEAVAALDAYGRGALSDSSQAVLGSSAAALAQAGLQALGPLRPFLLPFPTPLELLSRHAPSAAQDKNDMWFCPRQQGLIIRLSLTQAQHPGWQTDTGTHLLPPLLSCCSDSARSSFDTAEHMRRRQQSRLGSS